MERIMAIYDVEPSYAERFADVVNQREKVPFLVVPFTSLEKVKEYARKNLVEILLINSLVPEDGYREIEPDRSYVWQMVKWFRCREEAPVSINISQQTVL